MAFEHFLMGSHNFMVTALGWCGKRPLVSAKIFGAQSVEILVFPGLIGYMLTSFSPSIFYMRYVLKIPFKTIRNFLEVLNFELPINFHIQLVHL